MRENHYAFSARLKVSQVSYHKINIMLRFQNVVE